MLPKLQEIDFREQHRLANAVRVLSIDAVQAANSGHPGMPMGMADAATVLFSRHLKFDSACPDWPDRDRFILSAGHGSMLLYSLLFLTGYKDFGIEQIRKFRQLGSLTAGHPEYGHGAGIETTTGPLGQGFANAVGFAIAEEVLRSRFSPDLVDHRTYVMVGDGCLMEGISQEAAALAGNLKLSRLIAIWDDNRITIDGDVALSDSTDQATRFAASGWSVVRCDGHDPDSVDGALAEAQANKTPTLVACRSTIGFGSPGKQGTSSAHGSPLGDKEAKLAKAAYEWNHAPFEVPADLLSEWREIGSRGSRLRFAWQSRIDSLSSRRRAEYLRVISGEAPKQLRRAIARFKADAVASPTKIATRKASENMLKAINPIMPETIGGSADLTGSNNTWTPDLSVFSAEARGGRYIHFGIREHAMAAAMNGMSLHGGVRPYGGTFLCFSDYARPAIRLSALMGVPVVYVMTHDSIGLGEDGPTHQPVEHLAMLRATPNLNVIRPCDSAETAEAWQIALTSRHSPTVLALSRQSLPAIDRPRSTKNLTERGAYVIREGTAPRRVVLMASGSELSVAAEAQAKLESEGIGTRLVSMPCWEFFEQQDEIYRHRILLKDKARVAVEAGIRQGWDRWLCGDRGSEKRSAFVGMDGFGASGPAADLFEYFGITVDRVVGAAKALL